MAAASDTIPARIRPMHGILLVILATLAFAVGDTLTKQQAMRHPVPVARQIATLCESAPGRFVLGVGVGGEDRHEIEICGVDPRTRGRRTDESLAALRALLRGEPTSHACEFFAFDRFFDQQFARKEFQLCPMIFQDLFSGGAGL